MLPNIQASIHGARAPQDHVNAAALLYNIGETGVWVMVLGHTVELRHNPDSGRICYSQRQGKPAAGQAKQSDFPNCKTKENNKTTSFANLSSSP